jgi:hypothetical protein
MVTDFSMKAQWSQLASEATELTYRIGCRGQSSQDDMLISLVNHPCQCSKIHTISQARAQSIYPKYAGNHFSHVGRYVCKYVHTYLNITTRTFSGLKTRI